MEAARAQANPAGPDSVHAGAGGVSVVRALRILEILVEDDDGQSLSSIARRLDVNKQIASRLIDALDASSFIYREQGTDRIFLSYKVCNLGLRKLRSARLLEQCSSILQDLADRTSELARLAVVEGDSLYWVRAAVGMQRTLHINPAYTPQIMLYRTATGRAWLSTMPPGRARELLKQQEWEPRTPFTVCDETSLMAAVDEARRIGWALSFDESEMGVGAVAAPIIVDDLADGPRCVGTISVAAPTGRVGRDGLRAMAPMVTEAARRAGEMWPVGPLGSDPAAVGVLTPV